MYLQSRQKKLAVCLGCLNMSGVTLSMDEISILGTIQWDFGCLECALLLCWNFQALLMFGEQMAQILDSRWILFAICSPIIEVTVRVVTFFLMVTTNVAFKLGFCPTLFSTALARVRFLRTSREWRVMMEFVMKFPKIKRNIFFYFVFRREEIERSLRGHPKNIFYSQLD